MKSTDVNISMLFAMMKISVLLTTVTWNQILAFILTLIAEITTSVQMTSVLKEYVTMKKLIALMKMTVLMILAMRKLDAVYTLLLIVMIIMSVLLIIVALENVNILKLNVMIMIVALLIPAFLTLGAFLPHKIAMIITHVLKMIVTG
jgi:asparagine N-glycosylation enzyme membrane subunit Stt3